jgi:hypothetical protein
MLRDAMRTCHRSVNTAVHRSAGSCAGGASLIAATPDCRPVASRLKKVGGSSAYEP